MGYNYDLSTGWWWLEHDITWLFFVHEQVGMSSSQLTFIFFQRGWNHQADIVLYMFVYSLLHRMVKMTLLCHYTFGPDPLYGVLEANYWVIGWLNYWVTEWLDDWTIASLDSLQFGDLIIDIINHIIIPVFIVLIPVLIVILTLMSLSWCFFFYALAMWAPLVLTWFIKPNKHNHIVS